MSTRIRAALATVVPMVMICGFIFWRFQEGGAPPSLPTDEQALQARLRTFAPHAPAVRATPPLPRFRLHESMGSLDVARLHLSVPVIEGADEEGLKIGAAHVLGTGYPGSEANCAVAAHRDTLFRPLKDIHKGDVITFRSGDHRFRYQVTGTEIIDPSQVSVLRSKGIPEMTLVTCYPFYFVGHAPKRFIVHATLSRT